MGLTYCARPLLPQTPSFQGVDVFTMAVIDYSKEDPISASKEVSLATPHEVPVDPNISPDSNSGDVDSRPFVPMKWKLGSVLLICLISFGASWSARLTSSLKSTVKKELGINNTQFALLEASEELMVTLLTMISGIVTDRIGGAGMFPYSTSCYPVKEHLYLTD